MSPTQPRPYTQPSTGSHFLLKCLLLQITEVIFPALQLEWLWSAGNPPDTAFAYGATTGMKDEALARGGNCPFYHTVLKKGEVIFNEDNK